MRRCGGCSKTKSNVDFYKHKRDGFQSRCKDCKREENKLRNRTPQRRAYNKAAHKKWFASNGSKYYKNPAVRKRRSEAMKRYRNDPRLRARHMARWMVSRAIKSGQIERLPCSGCGAQQSQAHHPDYSKPLFIVWLCRSCHQNVHTKAGGRK